MSSNTEFAFVAPGATGYHKDHPAAAHVEILNREQGLVSLGGRKHIALCGFASSSRHRMPIDDPNWLIVGLNQLYRHIPRADVWFDIHSYWDEHNVEGTDHPRWIRECGIPVFMAEPYKDSQTTVRYPVERLIAKHGLDYFTSTVAFMVAWALECIDQDIERRIREFGATSYADVRVMYGEYTIGIFGVDMIVGTEYDWQKSCVEFWQGVCEGRGIKLYIPPECALLKQQYRYGYEREPDTGLIKMSELSQRHSEIEGIKSKLMVQMHGLHGSLSMLKDLKATIAELPPEFAAKETELVRTLERTVAELQTYDGAQQESAHMRQVLELRLRGGEIPLTVAHAA